MSVIKYPGSGGAPLLVPTAVKTGAYAAAAGELVLVDASAGSFTVTLPVTPADKTQVGIKMVTAPGVNTVSVAAGGTSHFNTASGLTSGTVALLGHSMFIQYQVGANLWFTLADDLPLSQTDARYVLASAAYTDVQAAGMAMVMKLIGI